STCTLKSSNFKSWISSGPCPGLTNVPFATVHVCAEFVRSRCHPVKSLPLNNSTGLPHFGVPDRFRDGALRPVQVHGLPSGLVVVPVKVPPVRWLGKTMSSSPSSSSLGNKKERMPADISTLGSGRAFPHRLRDSARHSSPCSRPP